MSSEVTLRKQVEDERWVDGTSLALGIMGGFGSRAELQNAQPQS